MFAINDKRVAMSDLWPLFKSLITWKCQIVALVVLILFIGKAKQPFNCCLIHYFNKITFIYLHDYNLLQL